VLAIGVLALPGTSVRAEPDRAPLEAWIAAQRDTQRLAIEFRQERILKGLTKPLVSQGRLWLDRRGLMRWQIGDPPRMIAVYKDESVSVIRPGARRVETRTLGSDSDQQGEMERAFLKSGLPTSAADFDQYFKFISTTREGDIARLRVSPKDSRAAAALQWIELRIDAAGAQLAGYDVAFRDGSQIRTRFTSVVVNPPVDDALFAPDVAGFRVEPLKP
jgi:outer membrane lipoprotein carrier protein